MSTQDTAGGQAMSRKRVRNKRCPYSASCFTCPLRDCIICAPAQINCLPVDFEQGNINSDIVKEVKAHG